MEKTMGDRIRVGMDGTLLRRSGGPATYIRNIVRELEEREDVEVVLFDYPGIPRPLREHVLIPSLSVRCDIFHHVKSIASPFFSVPQVVTLHDFIPLDFPGTESFPARIYWKFHIPLSLEYAKKIIVPSRWVEKRAVEYGVEREKIRVIYHGVEERFFKGSEMEIRRLFSLPEKFVLYVGTVKPRKNIERLSRVCERLKIPFVVAGRKGYMGEKILNSINAIYLGHVPDIVLPSLYRACTVFVYVSLAEGFGLPVLEALAAGAPVITSRNSPMEEFSQGACIYVNPEDEEEMEEKLRELLKDAHLRKLLGERGRRIAREFTWKRVGEETVRVYKEVV